MPLEPPKSQTEEFSSVLDELDEMRGGSGSMDLPTTPEPPPDEDKATGESAAPAPEDQEAGEERAEDGQPRDERGRFARPETEANPAAAAAEPPQVPAAPAKPTLRFPDGSVVTDQDLLDPAKVALIQSQLDNAGLRHDEFTRKTQELARQRRESEARLQQREQLVGEILDNERARELVSRFKNARELLLARPEYTRQVLQNPKELDRLEATLEAIENDPDLARRVIAGTRAEELEREVQSYRQRDDQEQRVVARQAWLNGFASELDTQLRVEAARTGLTEEALGRHILSTVAGVENFEDKTELEAGMETLFRVLTRRNEQGLFLRDDVVTRHANTAQRFQSATAAREASAQEAHNASVTAAIENGKIRAPAAPRGAVPAGVTEAKPKAAPTNFRGVLTEIEDDLYGGR